MFEGGNLFADLKPEMTTEPSSRKHHHRLKVKIPGGRGRLPGEFLSEDDEAMLPVYADGSRPSRGDRSKPNRRRGDRYDFKPSYGSFPTSTTVRSLITLHKTSHSVWLLETPQSLKGQEKEQGRRLRIPRMLHLHDAGTCPSRLTLTRAPLISSWIDPKCLPPHTNKPRPTNPQPSTLPNPGV
jgi:hypothetical protein